MNVRRLPFCSILIVSLVSATTARAGVFRANRLFVGAGNLGQVELFDSGACVGTSLSGDLDYPWFMAFGPDGCLYVSELSDNEVSKIDATGTVVQSFGSSFLTAPAGLAFGPNGRLYVLSGTDAKVVIFDTAGTRTGEFSVAADMTDPTGIVIGPDGHLLITDWVDNVIDEYDPSGSHLRAFGTGLGFPAGLALGPAGRIYVVNQFTQTVVVLDSLGAKVDEINLNSPGSAPLDCQFGPDGNLWVSCQGTNELMAFDLAGNLVDGIPAATGLDHPTGLAFAPFHFKAKVSGQLALEGEKPRKVSENVQLYLAPGSRRLMMEIDNLPAPSLSQFNFQYCVLSGFEGFQSNTGTKRVYSGRQQYLSGFETGGASLGLEVKGKISGCGFFAPRSAKGSFQRDSYLGAFNGKIVTSKLFK
ncbi:MAG: NHL repeat-containing protein [Planctomycetota bacterium]